eukprot:9457144-Pyramimonas_sp.AAC.1
MSTPTGMPCWIGSPVATISIFRPSAGSMLGSAVSASSTSSWTRAPASLKILRQIRSRGMDRSFRRPLFGHATA